MKNCSDNSTAGTQITTEKAWIYADIRNDPCCFRRYLCSCCAVVAANVQERLGFGIILQRNLAIAPGSLAR